MEHFHLMHRADSYQSKGKRERVNEWKEEENGGP